MAVKAVIFDCDGTLVDTEQLCAVAHTDVLRMHGVDFTPASFLENFLGQSPKDIVAQLNARRGLNIEIGEYESEFKKRAKAKIPTEMRVLPESLAFVQTLALRTKLAVGSNGVRDLILEELRVACYLNAIGDQCVFTANQVARSKPYPDLFLYAAEKIGADPADCLVVEDSPAGARAGLAAGMQVVGYIGLAHNPVDQSQALKTAGCVRVISRLSDLSDMLS